MPTPLEGAIATMQAEIDGYNLGTPQQPLAGSLDYYRLRALLVGHAMLLRIQALGIEGDVAGTERLYRAGTIHFGIAAVPPAPAIAKETVPEGITLPPGVPQ